MKLSMRILSDWLKTFPQSTNIIRGEAVLTGARLYSADSPEPDPSAVIVGYASQILPLEFHEEHEEHEEKVLCSHGKDWIALDHTDIGAILNAVLKAFEFYNEWESSIKDAAYSNTDTAFQTILDLSSPAIDNPMLIADWKGQVLAVSRSHKPIADQQTWNHWLVQGYLPSYTYDRLKEHPELLESMIHGEEIRIFEFPRFKYRCIHFSVSFKKEIAVYVHIIEEDAPLTPGLFQIAAVLKQTIAILLERSELAPKNNQIASLFSEIISGKEPDRDELNWVRSQLGWDTTKNWYLVTFRSLLSDSFSDTALLELLKKQVRRGCSFTWGKHLIMIIDCEEWTAAASKTRKLLVDSGFCCGVSMPFDRQKDMPFALKQAELSIELAGGENAIAMCADYAWSYIGKELKSQIIDMKMLHPVIRLLDEHDRRTGSQLSRTLYEYLRHERSADETANALFIHRNSLRYRLNRIKELIDTDLNNPDTRMHIMLSYHIKEMADS
ncbi:MAG: helix-turn-helix domain-containing protein [Rectinemataceae bacterium]